MMRRLKDIWEDPIMTGKRQLLEQLLTPLDEEDTLSTTENRLRSLMHGSTPAVSASIQEVLIPIMRLSRAMPVDVDASRYIPPESFDILITDITDSDIMEIGNELQHANLSDAVADGTFPVEGTFYGSNLRLFVPLTVKKRTSRMNRCKWVLFLVDTGSPFTFLRADTYEQLGFGESIPNSTQVLINGVSLDVSPSHGNFHNVNLLGQNFLKAAKLFAGINYATGAFSLTAQS